MDAGVVAHLELFGTLMTPDDSIGFSFNGEGPTR